MPDQLTISLLGKELCAVVFIWDYVQLQFNPDQTIVSIYTKCSVNLNGQQLSLGEKGFADLLISLIGQLIDRIVLVSDKKFSLGFKSDATITVSLLDEDQIGPEAALICVPGSPMIVL